VIRARIDTACGSWPAIWTLGISGGWPSGGEIDIMEFYRIEGIPTILANFAWGTSDHEVAKWDDLKKPLADFTANDPIWTRKFHVWRMDWNKDSISLFLDDLLLNTVLLNQTSNPDGFNPFLQPHYFLLNLAIGANGGDPAKTKSPIKYEVDYVRVYQNR
jgi:beta-glucanase (GH16 family)